MNDEKWFENRVGKIIENMGVTEIPDVVIFCIDQIIEGYDDYINNVMDKDDNEDRKIQENFKSEWIKIKDQIEYLR